MSENSFSAASAVASNLDGDARQTPSQIDGRRAQQLLERALGVAERGDVPAAIIACRQAIALNPTAPQGYSMLGLLLERSGDTQGAISAYEKVLQMDPGSLLERESLARLRASAAARRTTRNVFVFDDSELFDERAEELPARTASEGEVAPGSPAPAIEDGADAAILRAGEEQIVSPTEFAFAPSANETAAPPAAAAMAPATVAPATLSQPAPAVPLLKTPAAGSASTPAATGAAVAIPADLLRPPVAPLRPPAPGAAPAGVVAPAYEPPVEPTLLQKLRARPSLYFRGVPLAATTVVSLVFLLWAHNQAASRDAFAIAVGSAASDSTPAVAQREARPVVRPPGTQPANPRGDAKANPASDAVPVNPGGQAPTGPSNPSRGSAILDTPAAATAPSNAPTSSASAPEPPVSDAPPADTSAASPADSGATRPATGGAAPADNSGTAGRSTATSGTASGAGAAGSSAAPVNPAGSPNRDFTRVAPPARPVPPPRASAGAARDERAAARGDENAIAAVTRAIAVGGSDTAFRYQQRAALYLERGDSARAINDYQSAIAVYNDMIARNDRVALARSGIQTCQRAIQVAQARGAR